jgi:ABC-type branched-subunit amino acid transport system ATPase component
MLIGMLLRNFKNYDNYHYVRVTNKTLKNLTAYVGVNGVGKSAILEAINAFFNNPEWNFTKGKKREDVAITLVFVIEKSKTNILKPSLTKCLQGISDYFSSGEHKQFNNSGYPHTQELIKHRDELLSHINLETHYFLLVGKSFEEQKRAHFGAFDTELRKHLSTADYDPESDLRDVLELIGNLYAYVYIPVEGYAKDFLMLERREMQDLMSEDITKKIDIALTSKNLGGTKKTSVIESVNESLDGFINEINGKIQKIDSSYSFSVEQSKKKKLTASDVREQIIKSYFNIRTLKKNKKEISQHSSGEQRKALIDVASAFLADNVATEKCVILAIDEPEASMHTSSCFDQFERIAGLAEHHQCLITTHWYGFLPTIQNGNFHHVSKEDNDMPSIASFDLANYLEDKRAFPEDVELKSYFDFVASVLSLMKAGNNNWIFCEGSDDVNYIKAHLSAENLADLKLRIMPLGGIGNVIKIYEYLYVPFSENVEKKGLQGKILCVTDTDDNRRSFKFKEFKNGSENKALAIKRLQRDSNNVSLVSFDKDGAYRATSIEDAADASVFLDACKKVAGIKELEVVSKKLLTINYNNEKYANIFAGDAWIDSTKDRDFIREFVKNNKVDISCEYAKLMSNGATSQDLAWVKEITDFFNPPAKEKAKKSQ